MATTGPHPLVTGDLPVLTTARLTLRPLRDDDAAEIALLANDRDIARCLARLPHPYGIDDARYFLREIAPHELAWAITVDGARTLAGVAGLVPHPRDDTAELGYWLGRRHWGRGYATEAGRTIVDHGFGALGLSAVTSGCFTDNAASARVLGKLGFETVGHGTRACLAEGRDRPFIDMRLDRPA